MGIGIAGEGEGGGGLGPPTMSVSKAACLCDMNIQGPPPYTIQMKTPSRICHLLSVTLLDLGLHGSVVLAGTYIILSCQCVCFLGAVCSSLYLWPGVL